MRNRVIRSYESHVPLHPPPAESFTSSLSEPQEQHENVRNSFPGDTGILTAVEGCISLTLMHMNTLAHQWVQAVDYVESMLRKQLVAAIGKEVSPSEFG